VFPASRIVSSNAFLFLDFYSGTGTNNLLSHSLRPQRTFRTVCVRVSSFCGPSWNRSFLSDPLCFPKLFISSHCHWTLRLLLNTYPPASLPSCVLQHWRRFYSVMTSSGVNEGGKARSVRSSQRWLLILWSELLHRVPSFHLEDEDSMLFRNVVILPQNYVLIQIRRPQSKLSFLFLLLFSSFSFLSPSFIFLSFLPLSCLISFMAYIPYFEKEIEGGLWDHFAVCLYAPP
jgi:hypothetical protein